MIIKALIPVKSLSAAKSRLAAHLTQPQRRLLVLDMLHHVIFALRESGALASIAVVSPDPCVLEQARAWGALALVETQQGHNPALHAAALDEKMAGADALLTISADLPLLQPDDIRGMVERLRHSAVVLAASREGTGTNVLLVRPPLAVPYVFGPGSLQRYSTEAREQRLAVSIYNSPGTALDIDTIDDLEALWRSSEAIRGALAS
ncbi:MAG TPA: 2-phospho-L-lactate guanylyltransferase [Ktedonobacteraceae bacterium]|nr:2-phospho-L-lactate guanylyltransferase [Ktedonobacteraceae bacterium]